MVMQWTVNPPPSGTTGSIPVVSTSFRLVHIMVIISDCLSEDGSSILPRVAKLSQSMEVVYPSGLISHEIVGSNPTSATKPAANHC
jgi:hypothetical protein